MTLFDYPNHCPDSRIRWSFSIKFQGCCPTYCLKLSIVMPSFDFRILQSKPRPDGSYIVRISVAHNGTTRYINTDAVVNDIDEFKNGTIVKRPDSAIMNARLRKRMLEIQTASTSIEYIDGLTCSELVSEIKKRLKIPVQHGISLKAVFDEYIESARISNRSCVLFKECFKSLIGFVREDMAISHINFSTILRYEKFLRAKGNRPSTIRTKMSLFAKLIVYARRCGYVPSNFCPFDGYRPPDATVRECWLSIDQIKTLRDIPIKGTMENVTRNFIMLSYCLGGINIADLLSINFNSLRKSSHLKYIRKKTARQPKINKYVEFDIPREAWHYIDLLIQPDGFLGTAYQRHTNLHHYFSQCIQSLRNQTGIDNLIYYSARKSFAQHAFEAGVATSVIDFVLGHKLNKGGTSLYNYIIVTPTMATKAVRLVLDNLK